MTPTKGHVMLSHAEMVAEVERIAKAELLEHGHTTTPKDLLEFYEGFYDGLDAVEMPSFERSMLKLAVIHLRQRAHHDMMFKK